MTGCVAADLESLAPQPSLQPQVSALAAADIDAAAEDFGGLPLAPSAPESAAPKGDRLVAQQPSPERLTQVAPAAPAQASATAAIAAAVPESPSTNEVRVAAFAPLPPRSSAAGVDALIAKYARHYDLPEAFVRKVVKRESNFNPKAYNRGHWGLMQIKHQTARGMGYRGPAEGLFDAETNLIYSVKYLRGAYLVAGGDERMADRLYQSGYYYHAKRAGLLDETGLGRDRVRKRRY
ncbi:MAG: lytic transglycosylase domain-containing protein [Mesorhizobium sp.]|nr:lytic transglycosylase domain-containing protein [Mesorhizobium sp.]MCO5162943.1 lytic transglycosylase domain-containing protein [Mesorhizobium sp.]